MRSVRRPLAILLLSFAPAAPVLAGDGPRFVVVPRSAPLHIHPDRAASAVAAGDRDDTIAHEAFFHFRRVGDAAGGWVEIESDPTGRDPITSDAEASSTHCYPSPWGLGGLALRFHVPLSAIVQVTRRAVEVRLPDGTGASLSSGVALGEDADGSRLVQVDGFRFRAPIPPDAIADHYAGDATLVEHRERRDRLPDKARLSLGGAPFVRPPSPAYRDVEVVRRKRGATLVELAGGCGSYRLQVDAGVQLEKNSRSPRDGLLAILGASGKHEYVETGAAAFWPDGSVAGRAIRDTNLGTEVERRGPRRCFAQSLEEQKEAAASSRITVCFEATAVKTAPDFSELLKNAKDIDSADGVFGTAPRGINIGPEQPKKRQKKNR